MNKTPPRWMEEEARENPIVHAYLKHGLQLGFGQELFELMAQELARANGDLTKQLTKLIAEGPPPVVILKGAVK